MPTNDFLPFAGGVGANVISQSSYAALSSLLSSGFSAGTAPSNECNKVWRQSTIMAAVLAQFIVDETGQNAVDDGTTATLLANLKLAIQPAISRTAHAGGTADAITATFTNPPTTFVDGLSYYVRAASANATTTPTFTPNSGVIAAKTIVKGAGAALAAGDIAGGGHWIELQYDATLDKVVLLNPATGTYGLATSAEAQALTNALNALTPASLAAALQGANQSLATNGYQKLPGGLIVQWGVFNVAGSTTSTFSLPVAFASAGYAISASFGIPASGTANAAFVDTANYKIQNTYTSAQLGSWIAVGK